MELRKYVMEVSQLIQDRLCETVESMSFTKESIVGIAGPMPNTWSGIYFFVSRRSMADHKRKLVFRMAILTLLLLTSPACGQQKTIHISSISIENNPILWQGRINDRADLLQVWNDTATCIKNVYAGPYYMDPPEVIETQNLIVYAGHKVPGACDLWTRTIYIQAHPNQSSEAIYLAHEIVHIITGIDDRGHIGTDPAKWMPVFRVCGAETYYTNESVTMN